MLSIIEVCYELSRKLIISSLIWLRDKLSTCSALVDVLSVFVKKLPERYWTELHLKKALLEVGVSRVLSVDKIVFFIGKSSSFVYAREVFKWLPQESFELVLCNSKSVFSFSALLDIVYRRDYSMLDTDEVMKVMGREYPHCRVSWINEYLRNPKRYSSVVFCDDDAVLSLFYRGVYGVSLFSDCLCGLFFTPHFHLVLERSLYQGIDKIFCCGLKQIEYFRTIGLRCGIFDYGSCRYDCIAERKRKVMRGLIDFSGFDNHKKTLLFLPPHGMSKRFVHDWCVLIKKFTAYNVLVRVYDASYEDRLRNKVFFSEVPNAISTQSIVRLCDNVDFLSVADFVFCGGGGCFLTAIGMDKPVILLSKGTFFWERFFRFYGIKNIEDKLGTFHVDDYDKIAATLKDDVYWERQRVVRAELRKQFFSFHKEPSGKLIADELMRDLKAASVT